MRWNEGRINSDPSGRDADVGEERSSRRFVVWQRGGCVGTASAYRWGERVNAYVRMLARGGIGRRRRGGLEEDERALGYLRRQAAGAACARTEPKMQAASRGEANFIGAPARALHPHPASPSRLLRRVRKAG